MMFVILKNYNATFNNKKIIHVRKNTAKNEKPQFMCCY